MLMVGAIDLNRHGGPVNHRNQCRAGCEYAALFGCDKRGGALSQRFETRTAWKLPTVDLCLANDEGHWNPVNKGLMSATQNETLQS